MKIYLFLSIILLSNLFATQYTLDQLIKKAIENSPDIQLEKLSQQHATAKNKEAFSNYFPKIDFNGNYNYATIDSLPISKTQIHDTILTSSLTLQQLLYDFGITNAIYNTTKEQIKQTNTNIAETILRKKRDVSLAYYAILQTYALIEVAKESIKLNKAQLHRAKRYFEAGIRTKVDISDAKVQLIKAQIALKNEEFNLQSDYANLDKIVGFTSTNSYEIAKIQLDTFLHTPLPKIPFDLNNAITYAYQNRPILQSYTYAIAAQQALKKANDARYYPQLYLNANYQKTTAKTYSNLLNDKRYNIGVTLHWNIFNGGKDKAKIQQQQITLLQIQEQLKQKKLLVKEEVTKAYIAVLKAKEQITLATNLLQLSKEKFQQVTKQYEHGLSDYIELQTARQGYIDAKSNVVITLYSYYKALANLQATIGL